MAERQGEIEARIESVRQLSAVIGAVRGIAAARLHEARARLEGVRTYAETIGQAIAQALPLAPGHEGGGEVRRAGRRVVVAAGAEQGFVGGFNTRVLDAVMPRLERADPATCTIILAGSHLAMAAEERGLPTRWSVPMATHVGDVACLANRIADQLLHCMAEGEVSEVLLVHAVPAHEENGASVVVRPLVPFDFARFPSAPGAQPPIIQLPAPVLLERLADEYIFAEICEALVLSFAAENEARMQAMVAASENVATRLEDLTATARRMRQDQITEEVIELAAGTRQAAR